MKLEVGKFYKTRDGRKVGPMKNNWSTSGHFCWCVDVGCCSSVLWDEVGCSGSHCDNDLIAPWPAEPTGPVRTVTRTTREIVPGTYGDVRVGKAVDDIIMVAFGHCEPMSPYSAAELRALAATAVELADALEDGQ